MKKTNKRKCMRNCAGELIIEMMAGLMILIPIGFVCLDIGALMLGAIANETVCRNAARSAAAGPKAQLLPRVNSVIPNASQQTGCFVWHQVAATDVSYKTPDSMYARGSVSAKTRLTINLPAPIPGLPSAVDVTALQVFPYTYAGG